MAMHMYKLTIVKLNIIYVKSIAITVWLGISNIVGWCVGGKIQYTYIVGFGMNSMPCLHTCCVCVCRYMP